MISRWMRAAALLAMAPAAALAFETVDTIPWPSSGAFPAYPPDASHPWGLFVQGGAMYDDNVLRTTDGEQNDTILRAGAGIRAEGLIYGRQRLLLEALAAYYDYGRFNVLDHFAHGIRGEWQWELGNSLAGILGYRRSHRLADIGELQRPVRDMITDDRLYLSGGYRFMANWRLTGGAEWGQVEHSGRALAKAEGNMVRGGLEYVSALGNTLGVEYRRAQGDAPVAEEIGLGAFPDNKFEEREVAATLSYRLGTTLRAAGRIGRTEREYTELPNRGFSGTTGRALLEWIPEVKTILVFEVYREARPVIDTDALHVIRRGVAFGPSWAPTLKLVFSARLVNERRVYQGDPAVDLTGVILRDETFRSVRLAAGWEPQRHWQVGASIDRGTRESNRLGRDYTYNAFTLNLKWTY